MRDFKVLLLPILSFLTLHCNNKITSPQYLDQFPLRVGLFWDYQSQDHRLHKEIISYERMPNNRWGYKLETSLTSKTDTSAAIQPITGYTYLTFESNQLREYYRADCPSAYAILLEFPLRLDQGWFKYLGNCIDTVSCETTEAGMIVCSIRTNGPFPAWDTVKAMADISTPFAEFTNSFGIKEASVLPSYRLAWFEPQIGFIKYEKYGQTNSEDFVLADCGTKEPFMAVYTPP